MFWWTLVACAPDALEPVVVDPDHDWDGDGFSEDEGDCDDTAEGVHPAASELCDNAIDDDCDGEEVSCDDDLDGVTTAEGDCNDDDARVFPGAPDICSNGLDEDCSGQDSTCAWSGELLLPSSAFGPGGFVFGVGDLDGDPGPEVAWLNGVLDILTIDELFPTPTLYSWATLTNDIAPSLDGGAVESVARLTAGPRLAIGAPSLDAVSERGAVLLNEQDWTAGTTPASALFNASVVLRGSDGQRIGRSVEVLQSSKGTLVSVGGYLSSPVWLVPSGLPTQEWDIDDVAVATLYPPLLTPDLGGWMHGADIDGDGEDELAISTVPFTGLLDAAAKVYVVEAEGPDRVLDPDVDALEASGTAVWTVLHTTSADVDGDGYEDLIVGYYTDEPGGAPSADSPGAVHVHLGRVASGAADWIDGRTLGSADLTVVGDSPGGWFGAISEPAGDVDGDGFGELWVGAPLAGDDERGTVTLVSTAGTGIVDLADQPEAILARLEGRPAELLGIGLVVEDFTLDGEPDLLVASQQALYIVAGGVIP